MALTGMRLSLSTLEDIADVDIILFCLSFMAISLFMMSLIPITYL